MKFRNSHLKKTVLFVCLLAGLVLPARAAELTSEGETIVKSACVGCHRIQGAPMPRSTKHAPDLIWAGNKYQRTWLVAWLQNPKQRLYPVGYDFKVKRKGRHLSLSPGEAEKVADFLRTLKEVRITEGIMKPGTPEELKRGEQLYREHACQNCHWTPANNRRGYAGGTSSTSLVNMGNRLQADWVYRFNLNPEDFEPRSGAYIPNPPLPEKDIYAITAYMMTFK
jgi:mono/diheme cytochrome c family protein